MRTKTLNEIKGIGWSGIDVESAPIIGKIITLPLDLGKWQIPSETLNVVEITEDGDIFITDKWYKRGVPQIVHAKMVEKFIPR